MKKLIVAVTLLAFTGVAMTPASAKTRKMVTVEQPSPLSCILVPFPGTGCPVLERMVGGALWGGALGLGIGAVAGSSVALSAGVTHAAWTGAAIGGGAGVVLSVITP